MIQLTMELTIDDEKQLLFEDSTIGILEPTRNQKGCLSCHISKDIDHPEIYRYSARWDSMSQLHAHLDSKYFRRFLVAFDLLSTNPGIWMDNTEGRHTLESIDHLYDFIGHSKLPDMTSRNRSGRSFHSKLLL